MSIGKGIVFAAGMGVFACLAINGPHDYCWAALLVTLAIVFD